jgi:hemoglobin
MAESLYERLGGRDAMVEAMHRFYVKVLADEVTRPFFAPLDLVEQARKQVAFMAWAFGGPNEYRGRGLRAAHAPLVEKHGLAEVHFDHVIGHLVDTLGEMGVAPALVEEAREKLVTLRDEVLGR